ncbi:MAG: hypothetical protein Kow0022_06910 [Phycisphaerales bacterium]
MTLSSRIVVDGEPDLVRRLVGARGIVRSAGPRGFVLVQTPNVQRAVALAEELMRSPGIGSVEIDVELPRAERFPSDPFFPGQWNLHNFANPAADVNAVPAWDLGYTGLGVVVGVLELGWQVDHPDLAPNFIEEASMPASAVTTHATSVAGLIAADNDNGAGGVGLAYDAGISRLIFGLSSQTADAFLFRNDLNDIKNNSWGPADNGRISYMSAVERAAIEQSIAEGRGGLGEIFVWAAGNGGPNDRMDYDPYASNRYTIAVGAVGDQNVRADYNETGSSMFIVSHSSGNVRGIFSTTLNSGYTTTFGGTSASAPLASAAIALMLQANPDLTWRDVQHILAETAWKVDPTAESWTINGAGRAVSEDYGFGALDAAAAVTAAQSWVSVPDEVAADSGLVTIGQTIPDDSIIGLQAAVTLDRIVRVESVEVFLNVDTTTVGDLRIVLTSPSGTVSTLAVPRFDSTDNLVDYVFTSLGCWGESSAGTWTLRISDERAGESAFWRDVRIVAHGTPWSGSCGPDLNGDGLLNATDVELFLNAYHGSDPVADFVPDGHFDFFDLQAFLNALAEGCR